MNGPVIDRRVAQATALRGFFQDQWEHLSPLFQDRQHVQESFRDDPAIQACFHSGEYADKERVEQLSFPGKLSRLQDEMLRINKTGIKLPLESGASSDLSRFHEVEIVEDHSRVAVIVHCPRSEFLTHLNQVSG